MTKKISCPVEAQPKTAVTAQLVELVALAMTSWHLTLRLSLACVALSLPMLGLHLLLR